MQEKDLLTMFGPVVHCNCVQEMLAMLEETPHGKLQERKRISCFYMISIALRVCATGTYFRDAMALLDDLSRARAEFDIAVGHDVAAVEVTSRLLLKAQQFVDETTIPCTEWPTTAEIASCLIQEAQVLLAEKEKVPPRVPYVLLRDVVSSCDALIMRVTSLGAQEYVGQVERVYSRRFEGPQAYDAGPLKFVGSSGSWGNVTIEDGELCLVFMSYSVGSCRYYQRHWHGHFTLQEQRGELLAVANWHLLEHGPEAWGPENLAKSAFQLDSATSWKIAMPFALLEAHLIDELAHLQTEK